MELGHAISIESLPTELLAKVLLLCISCTDSSFLDGFPLSVTTPPAAVLELSTVCRRWRAVIISTPNLWSILPEIVLDDSANRKHQTHLRIVRKYLALSRASPISFTMKNLGPAIEASDILDAIIPHSDRWRHVGLVLRPASFRSLAKIRGRLPALCTLHIQIQGQQPNTMPFIDVFEVAPRLSHVMVTSDLPLDGHGLKLPMSQLNRYSGLHFDIEDSLHFLQSAPQITQLEMRTAPFYRSRWVLPVSSHGSVVLRELNSLHLDEIHINGNPDRFGRLLSHLTLPNLNQITVKSRDIAILKHLISLISRSFCSLTVLELNEVPLVDDEGIVNLLRLTPLLIRLVVWHIGYATLTGLIVEPGKDPLVPALRDLEIILPASRLDALADMLLSRCSHGNYRPTAQLYTCILYLSFPNDCRYMSALLDETSSIPNSKQNAPNYTKWHTYLRNTFGRSRRLQLEVSDSMSSREPCSSFLQDLPELDHTFSVIESHTDNLNAQYLIVREIHSIPPNVVMYTN